MALLKEKPQIEFDQIPELVLKHYGLDVTVKSLPGERDLNFRLKDTSGNEYVCKIANSGEPVPFLEAQTEAMVFLRDKGIELGPEVLKSVDGNNIVVLEGPGSEKYHLRLLSYLTGTPLADVKEPSTALYESLGFVLAEMDKTFLNFDHPALHREFYWDLAQAPDVIQNYLPDVDDDDLKNLIEQCLQAYKTKVIPVLENLRKSVIHNDANDHNLLIDGDRVVGVLDFGDMIHSHTVNDLAIAVAYTVLEKTNILEVINSLVRSYHQVLPLNRDELDVLHTLVCMRQSTSICVASHQMKLEPDNRYLAISQKAVRESLPKMLVLDGALDYE